MKRFALLPLLAALAAPYALAQKGGGAPVVATPSRNGGNDAFYNTTGISAASLVVYGNVALESGAPPSQLVMVERVCGGLTQAGGFADSKGRFSFELGVLNRTPGLGGQIDSQSSTQMSAHQISGSSLAGCMVRANLAGYHSQSVPLSGVAGGQKNFLGAIILKPFGVTDAASLSATDSTIPKNARKDFEKGLDAAAKAKWQDAMDSLQKAVAGYPKYASAWLALGQLQAGSGNAPAALQSYLKAMSADERFAVPFLEAAVLESQAGNWDKTAEYSGRAAALVPGSFPRAWLLHSTASLNLKHFDVAEKSAAEGLALDGDRQFPDLFFNLGVALMARKDTAGARKNIETYLSLAPNGLNADAARQTLPRLP